MCLPDASQSVCLPAPFAVPSPTCTWSNKNGRAPRGLEHAARSRSEEGIIVRTSVRLRDAVVDGPMPSLCTCMYVHVLCADVCTRAFHRDKEATAGRSGDDNLQSRLSLAFAGSCSSCRQDRISLASCTLMFGCVLLVPQPLCHLKSGCVPPILFLALALSPPPVEPFDSGIEQGEKRKEKKKLGP